MLEAIWLDLRGALRGLSRARGFSTVVVVTVGLALGATTSTVTVLQDIVLQKVKAINPERLVSVSAVDPQTNNPGYIYADTFQLFKAVQGGFSSMSMYSARYYRVQSRGETMDGMVEGVTSDYFQMLGVTPRLGRFFDDIDVATNSVVVLSDRFHRRLFGDVEPGLGQILTVDGRQTTIIGITEPEFEGLQFDGGTDIFVPLQFMQTPVTSSVAQWRVRTVIARLAPGARLTDVSAQIATRWSGVQQRTIPSTLTPAEQEALRSQQIKIEPIHSGFSTLRDRYGLGIVTLVGLSGALLLVACLNLAALFLARVLCKRNEFSVRLAMGASRPRAALEVLLEALTLTTAGFILSLPIAWLATREVTAAFMFGRTTPIVRDLTPDFSTVSLSFALAVLMGLAVSSFPAWRAGTLELVGESTRTTTRGWGRVRRILLTANIAVSLTLLVAAGLFTNSLSNLRSNYDSIGARNVALTRLSRVVGDQRPLDASYWRTLLDKLGAIQGVQSTALSVYFPTYLQFPGAIPTERYSATKLNSPVEMTALTEYVSPGFFDTFGIARLTGRDFTWSDDAESRPVAILTRSVAARLLDVDDAIGRRLRAMFGTTIKDFEVVGVVDDGAFGNVRNAVQPTVFRPILQEPSRAASPMAHVRYQGSLRNVVTGYTNAVEAQGRHFVRAVFTFDQFSNAVLLNERLIASSAIFVGGLIMLLACIGVFSILSNSVNARVKEIGVRSALGATRPQIARLILRDGLSVVLPGVMIGVAVALAGAGIIQSQLYGIRPTDLTTFAGAVLAVIVTALIASLIPAFRACAINPVTALHQE